MCALSLYLEGIRLFKVVTDALRLCVTPAITLKVECKRKLGVYACKTFMF